MLGILIGVVAGLMFAQDAPREKLSSGGLNLMPGGSLFFARKAESEEHTLIIQ